MFNSEKKQKIKNINKLLDLKDEAEKVEEELDNLLVEIDDNIEEGEE